MIRIRTILAISATALLLGAVPALAETPSVDQYGNPVAAESAPPAVAPATPVAPSGGGSSATGGTGGTSTTTKTTPTAVADASDDPVADPAADTITPTKQVTVPLTGGAQLPFTGAELRNLLIAGLLLMGGGYALRRSAQD